MSALDFTRRAFLNDVPWGDRTVLGVTKNDDSDDPAVTVSLRGHDDRIDTRYARLSALPDNVRGAYEKYMHRSMADRILEARAVQMCRVAKALRSLDVEAADLLDGLALSMGAALRDSTGAPRGSDIEDVVAFLLVDRPLVARAVLEAFGVNEPRWEPSPEQQAHNDALMRECYGDFGDEYDEQVYALEETW